MSEPSQRWGRVPDWLWLLAWGTLSSVWCVTASSHIGATFDEPLYLERGLEGWRAGSHRGLLRVGTMPLPIDIQTLPLFLYEKWTGVLLDPVADCGRLLPRARAGTLVFWWLLLAYAMLAGRHLAGPWGGRAAVAVVACEPNLLAHAALATTDIAVTAALVALVYHFHTARGAGWGWRVAMPAAWLAVAFLAKASGLVFGPLILLATEVGSVVRERRARGESPWPTWSAFAPFRRDAVQVFVLALVLAFAYCGSDWQPASSFVAWAHDLPAGPARSATVWLAENLCVFSNAGEGLVRQVRHDVRGHGAYLLGEVHPRALWYYFPVALSIKLPIPLLLLPLAVAVARPRALANWACLAAAALLLFSLTCRVQIGVRLVLPLVALAAIGLAAAAVSAWRDRETRTWGLSLSPCLLLVVGVPWMVASAVAVWPHGLCYANEVWGGRECTYRRLSDSNFDWGQGLKDLARWQREHDLEVLDVWYFGTDPAVRSMPVRQVPLHALPVAGPEDVRAHVRGRYLAVGATLVHGSSCLSPSHARAAECLRRREPVGLAGTFLIYDLGDGTAEGR